MSDKYLLFNLEDDKAKKLGEIISNLSCKKIINLLAEKELSISNISREINMPMNSVQYNISKLLEAGLIEEAKSWWSVKGKKMPTYKVANKLIVISPKKTSNFYSKLKSVVPVVLVSSIFTSLFFWTEEDKKMTANSFDAAINLTQNTAISGASQATENVAKTAGDLASVSSGTSAYIWIIILIWLGIFGFVIYSFIKNK